MHRFTYLGNREDAISEEPPLVGLSEVLVGLSEVSAEELVVGGSIIGQGVLIVKVCFSVVTPIVVSGTADADIVI
jgi:hypothetical protein